MSSCGHRRRPAAGGHAEAGAADVCAPRAAADGAPGCAPHQLLCQRAWCASPGPPFPAMADICTVRPFGLAAKTLLADVCAPWQLQTGGMLLTGGLCHLAARQVRRELCWDRTCPRSEGTCTVKSTLVDEHSCTEPGTVLISADILIGLSYGPLFCWSPFLFFARYFLYMVRGLGRLTSVGRPQTSL